MAHLKRPRPSFLLAGPVFLSYFHFFLKSDVISSLVPLGLHFGRLWASQIDIFGIRNLVKKNDQMFNRFYVDFGAILAPNLEPKSLPKSCQTMLILTLRANLAPKRAQEAPRRLSEGLGDHFWTILDQF